MAKNAIILATLALLPLLRRPETQVPLYLAQAPHIRDLARHPVAPAILIRSLAILMRSAAMHVVWQGIVMAVGSLILQAGVWAGLVWALPTLLRPYQVHINHHQAAVLATVLCGPAWLGGVLFILPEDPLAWLLVSRLALLICVLYGARLFERALHVVPCSDTARLPALASAFGAYAAVYMALFVVVGVLSNVVLLFFKES